MTPEKTDIYPIFRRASFGLLLKILFSMVASQSLRAMT